VLRLVFVRRYLASFAVPGAVNDRVEVDVHFP